MGDDEPPGIERRHGNVRNVQVRYLLASYRRSIRVENLQVREKGRGRARAPPDHEIAVDQAGHHRLPVQPWDGIGTKLGAVSLALESETLRADALILPLVCPNDDEAPVG